MNAPRNDANHNHNSRSSTPNSNSSTSNNHNSSNNNNNNDSAESHNSNNHDYNNAGNANNQRQLQRYSRRSSAVTLSELRNAARNLLSSLYSIGSLKLSSFRASPRDAHWNPGMYNFRLHQFECIAPKSKLNPKARSGHRMVADEAGDLYSFGGFNFKVLEDDSELSYEETWQKYKPLFQELWKFHWKTAKWEKLRTTGDIPDKLVSHCMYYWNEKIIIYGGTGLPFGDSSSNKLTIYHIDRKHWEVIEPITDVTKNPVEMYGQACVCDEQRGEIYIVGGTNGSQYSLDVHRFNLYTKKWTMLYKSSELDDLPGCRYRHEIALYNNRLYLFGGSTSSRYYAFDELPVFDLETLDWTYCKTKPQVIHEKLTYPKARKCHSLAIIGNDCYICGGVDAEQKVCSDIWHINLDELTWRLMVERIPFPVYFHAASVSFGSKLTVFGGVDSASGNSRNNKLTSIWLKVPSLKNICLSALSHYVLHGTLTAQQIRTTGLSEAIEIAESVEEQPPTCK